MYDSRGVYERKLALKVENIPGESVAGKQTTPQVVREARVCFVCTVIHCIPKPHLPRCVCSTLMAARIVGSSPTSARLQYWSRLSDT